jgi:DNA helicase-2/ATP-dependent DNA helicase PcrA
MSDASVATALRSNAPLVVVEAPAGCGKTHQGADYARDVAAEIGNGRVLILTHTHAACDVFAARTQGMSSRVDVRTIDSLIAQIGGAYHLALGIPSDAGAWARARTDGYAELASKISVLLLRAPFLATTLSARYPVVVCDEHQDASNDQHALVLALHAARARVRVFADPMQRIYGGRTAAEIAADKNRWENLKATADKFEELDEPHRWKGERRPLGDWILRARAALKSGNPIDLRNNLPSAVRVLTAENISQRNGGYQVTDVQGRPIRDHIRNANAVMILGRRNETVAGLRSFFNRSVPIWEGHTRDALSCLAVALSANAGNAPAVARATVSFIQEVSVGFSSSAFANALISEVDDGCSKNRRGKPAALQGLARHLLESPDHRGVAKALRQLAELAKSNGAFRDVVVDHYREYSEACRLGQYENANEGFAEISKRRTFARPVPPAKCLSTIHKAKGLETSAVVVMPCDKPHFSNTDASRCLLYVAMSRATQSLTFVVSAKNKSPLIEL